jgi:hypothetical protein
MSYVGLNPQQQLLNTSTETFSGNAVAYEFTLDRAVASASDLDVMIGQTLQRPFADYTAENTSLLFQTPPASGTNNITVTYRAGALNSLNLTANAFGAGTVGAPSIYSVAANNSGLYFANATSVVTTVAGTARLVVSGNANSSSNTTGALQVIGGAGITGNINTSGRVVITDSTQSTSVSTGALLVSGGIATAGNMQVGGSITCVGNFTVNGTFTTTGTDSLDVTDPFIFLANANPGDTYDTGVVSQFYDGTNNRYTGYFRDITDNKYKLFGNLLTKPGTTVDTLDPSFRYQDLILANLSATGNVSGTFILGNGSQLTGILTTVSNVTNGTSGVFVPALNGNVIINVGGATISTVSSSVGLAIVGNVNATTGMSAAGNIVGGNIVTAGIASATGNLTSAANISGGNILTGGQISAAGALTAGGTATITGNTTVTANISGGNIATAGQASAGGNVTGGNIRTAGSMSATGAVYGDSFSATQGISAGAGISAGTDITAGNDISATGAVNAGTSISAVGNITGSFFLGNGRLLSGIDATSIQNGTSNVRVVAANANVAFGIGGTSNVVVVASTGQFTTGLISASGNITGGNINTAGIISSTGNITGGNLSGTSIIGTLTTAAQTNITSVGTLSALNSSGAISAVGNVTGGNLMTGGLISAGTTITAVGTITGGNLATTGTITAGSTISATGNVTGGNINTAGIISSTGNSVHGIANVIAGNAIITSLVQAATLSATGNVIGGNLNAAGLSLSGNVVSGLSMITNIITTANITGGNISTAGNLSIPTAAVNTNTTQAATTAFVVGQASATTPQLVGATGAVGTSLRYAREDHVHEGVTSVAVGTGISTSAPDGAITLTNTGVTSAVAGTGVGVSAATGGVTFSIGQAVATSSTPTFAGLTVGTGSVTAGNIINSNANGIGNIGSATVYFNTVFGKATTAQYADLAENYSADAEYAPGTVLVFGGNNEVTISSVDADARVAGVISTNPAHLMNSTLNAEHVAAVALTGRVPTNVVGSVRKGDMMVTAGNGHAQACATPAMGTVIGKALQDFDGDSGTIEIVVGRL